MEDKMNNFWQCHSDLIPHSRRNIDGRVNEETVKPLLIRCAAEVEGGADLVIDKVELLTKEKDPRTKCWKIFVPHRFKTFMEKDEVYPTGWRHRTFLQGAESQLTRKTIVIVNRFHWSRSCRTKSVI